MKDWSIIALSVALVIAGWVWMSQPRIKDYTVSFAGWIVAIGLVMFSLSLYNILKTKK